MFAARSALVTEAEFLALPESMDKLELVDGEVLLAPSPLPRHQQVVARLLRALDRWAQLHPPHEVLPAPLDIRFGPNRILQPDLCVFARPVVDELPVRQIPVLVIEVLSAARAHDRLTKRLIYAEAGVPEYWILDPAACTVEQILGLETVSVESSCVTARALDGLAVALPEVFGG